MIFSRTIQLDYEPKGLTEDGKVCFTKVTIGVRQFQDQHDDLIYGKTNLGWSCKGCLQSGLATVVVR